MASKRFQRSVSALILTAVLLSGCQAGAQKKGKDGSGGNAVTDGSTSDINNTSSDTLTSGTSEETPANTPTPAFTPTPTLSPAPKYENNSTNVDGHHEFQPHVFSVGVGMDRENKDVICEDYSGYTFTFHYGK